MIDEKCALFVDEVLKFRRGLNLTSIADGEEFVRRFVTPSLALLDWIPAGSSFIDIGSGMGVPGIPLLMNGDGLRGMLVERRKKRAEFLRHVVRKISLNAEVYDEDINALPGMGVDVVVARAVTDECGLLRMASSHVNQGGLAVLPVPMVSSAVCLDQWTLIDEQSVGISDEVQIIRCYKYDK